MSSLRAADLEELLNTNNVPSQETARLVKEMLSTPKRNLRALDEKISEIEQQLRQLKTQRKDDHEWILRHAAILSPIRDIPADILQEIFCHVLPTDRNPTVKATEGPILLTHICKRWREIALASAGLWSRLHVSVLEKHQDEYDFQPYPTVPYSFDSEENTDAVKLTSERWEPVKEWLSRSGASPLSLSIDLKGVSWFSPTRPPSPELVHTITALFHILSSCSNRWERLQVQGPIDAFRLLENTTSTSDLPMLTFLRADLEMIFNPVMEMMGQMGQMGQMMGQTGQTGQTPNIRPFALVNAPSLRGLSIHINQPMLCGIPDPSIDWIKFTHISSHFPLSISDTVFLLENCRNLGRFKVVISENRVLSGDVLYVHTTPIVLPHLRSLWIIETLIPQVMANIYSKIVAPELRSIGYANKLHSHAIFTDEQLDPILELIQKSPMLQKLTFDTVSINTPGSLRKILLASHNISHLVIGAEMQAFPKVALSLNANLISSTRLTPSQRGPRPGTAEAKSWNFNEALADNARDIESGSPLVPYLEFFDFKNGSIHLSDSLLLEFILSRMNPSATNIAVLKHIGINFDRPQEQDISEVIYQRARLAGINIKLDLKYLEPYTQDEDFTGVQIRSFRNDNGPTWFFKDIEDLQ